jgi:hypothetical protein
MHRTTSVRRPIGDVGGLLGLISMTEDCKGRLKDNLYIGGDSWNAITPGSTIIMNDGRDGSDMQTLVHELFHAAYGTHVSIAERLELYKVQSGISEAENLKRATDAFYAWVNGCFR